MSKPKSPRQILENKIYYDKYKDDIVGINTALKSLAEWVRGHHPIAWYCPVCKKFDMIGTEPLAKPEHIPHRGFDIGSCKGKMIKLIPLTELEEEIVTKHKP